MTTMLEPEERVVALMDTVRFLYPDEQYPHDETTIRAMIVQGGTDIQIREAVAVAAINMRVGREDKTRYAAGVLRNLMHPSPRWVPDEDDPEDPFGPEDPDDVAEALNRQGPAYDDIPEGVPSRFLGRRRRRRWDRELAEQQADDATWD